MLTFFHSPGSCSNGILLLLHELEATFDCQVVDVRNGDQYAPAYRALNPKGKVPALRMEDGAVLTEFPAVATWLVAEHRQAKMHSEDPLMRARVVEALDFIVGSVHMRGFTFVKMPTKFLDDPEGRAALRAHGRTEVDKGLAILSQMLGGKDYLLGDLTAADFALFYVLSWAETDGFDIPRNLAACLTRLRARPAHAAAAPLLQRRDAPVRQATSTL